MTIMQLREENARLRHEIETLRAPLTLRELCSQVSEQIDRVIADYQQPTPVEDVLAHDHFREATKKVEDGDGSCSVEWCRGTAQTRGYCSKHYRRFRSWGDPTLYKRITGRGGSTCNVMCRETGPKTMEEVEEAQYAR